MSPGERLRQRLEDVEPFGEDGQLRGKVAGTDQTVLFTLDGEVWADVSAELGGAPGRTWAQAPRS
jgi:hypothetical protein